MITGHAVFVLLSHGMHFRTSVARSTTKIVRARDRLFEHLLTSSMAQKPLDTRRNALHQLFSNFCATCTSWHKYTMGMPATTDTEDQKFKKTKQKQ